MCMQATIRVYVRDNLRISTRTSGQTHQNFHKILFLKILFIHLIYTLLYLIMS